MTVYIFEHVSLLCKFAELLPSESLAVHLNRLATVKLSNNRITEKEPFYIPKFILELPKYVFTLCNCTWQQANAV